MSKNKNRKAKKLEILAMIGVTVAVAALCALLVFLVIKFNIGADADNGTGNVTEAPTQGALDVSDEGYKYYEYISANDTQTEGAFFDTKTTGAGIYVDMEKIESQINAYRYGDFAKSEGVTDFAVVRFKNLGDVIIALRDDIAPETVNNFKKLAIRGFYNNTIITKLKDYLVEGGSISTTGETKKSDAIKGEFSNNGFQNNIKHIQGVISMGRSENRDSAQASFFVCTRTAEGLDNLYASFGYIVAGYDVIAKIAEAERKSENTEEGSAPKESVVIKEVFFVEPRADKNLGISDKADSNFESKTIVFVDGDGKPATDLAPDKIVITMKKLENKGWADVPVYLRTNASGEARVNLERGDYRIYIRVFRGDFVFEEFYNLEATQEKITITVGN